MRRGLTWVAVLLFGCQAPAALGSTCTRNSDCTEPLVCAGGLCRAQCVDARDCNASETCSPFHAAATAGVCVPPAMPVPCAFHSDCAEGLFCHSGACTVECMTDRDCAAGHCVDGACSTPAITPPGGDAGVGPDGSACATMCGSRCVDTTRDAEHCGGCANACAPGQICSASLCVDCPMGSCPPANDTCSDALVVTPQGFHTHVSFDGTGATPGLPSCDSAQASVYFAFDLAQRSLLVGRVAIGAAGEVSNGWLHDCGGTMVTCTGYSTAVVADPGREIFSAGFDVVGPHDVDFDVLGLGASTEVTNVGLVLGATVTQPGHVAAGVGSGVCGLSGSDAIVQADAVSGMTGITCSGLPLATVSVLTETDSFCAIAHCDGASLPVSTASGTPVIIAIAAPDATTSGEFALALEGF